MRSIAAMLTLLAAAIPAGAGARDSLGVFEGWAAFRDPAVPRCYAIAQPASASSAAKKSPAFAAVGTWPRQRVRGQFHVRLSRDRGPDAPVHLSIGERRFALKAAGADAWAQDRKMDAAIVAAMRSVGTMSVETRGRGGGRFSDLYVLRGASTAMDAAALACSR